MTHKERTHGNASFLLCNMWFVVQQRHRVSVAVVAPPVALMELPKHTKVVQLPDVRFEGGSGQAESFLHLAQAGKNFPAPVVNAF